MGTFPEFSTFFILKLPLHCYNINCCYVSAVWSCYVHHFCLWHSSLCILKSHQLQKMHHDHECFLQLYMSSVRSVLHSFTIGKISDHKITNMSGVFHHTSWGWAMSSSDKFCLAVLPMYLSWKLYDGKDWIKLNELTKVIKLIKQINLSN